MRKWIWRIAAAVALLAVLAVIGYGRFWRAVEVDALVIELQDLTLEVSGTGLLDARQEATVSTRIQGRIDSIEVDQGDAVEAGQVICRLDGSDLRRQVEISEATVEAASAAIRRAQADVDRAGAVLALAERELSREQAAAERGAGSVAELDRLQQQAAIASADQARAEASLLEARQQLIAAERTLDYRRAQLDETVITSPFDGVVVRRDRDRGDVVVPGSSIVRVVAPEALWVSAWVDEISLASLAIGQQASVVFRSEPGQRYAGQVARLGLEVDPETRETLVDVLLDEVPARWAIGQRAEVYIATETLEQTIAVPRVFVTARNGETGVYIERGGRARWRPVELGARGRDRVQALSGLEAGDRVVRAVGAEAGASPLRPGKRVTAP